MRQRVRPGLATLLWLVAQPNGGLPSAAAQTSQRLVALNQSLILDAGAKPTQLRAVLYSPTPWGYDDELYYKAGGYEAQWPALFSRDLDLMHSLGANAVRLHGFFGIANSGEKHTAFLDAAAERNMSVLLSYDLLGTGSRAKILSSPAGLTAAKADLRFFVRAAKHPATVMVFLGEALNR